jgi:hypothetical protein
MKVHLLFDGGYSDRSVLGVFSTPEKLAAFVKRYEVDVDDLSEPREYVVDEYDDSGWPPGRSYYVIVRPAPMPSTQPKPFPSYVDPLRTRYRAIEISACIRPYSACTREWRFEKYDESYRTEFWGTYDEAVAFAEAKLVEERDKLPPGRLPAAYIGNRTP